MTITDAVSWLVTNVILAALGAGMTFAGYLGVMGGYNILTAANSSWLWMLWGAVQMLLMFTWGAIGLFAAIICLSNIVLELRDIWSKLSNAKR